MAWNGKPIVTHRSNTLLIVMLSILFENVRNPYRVLKLKSDVRTKQWFFIKYRGVWRAVHSGGQNAKEIWLSEEQTWLSEEQIWLSEEQMWLSEEQIWLSEEQIWLSEEQIWLGLSEEPIWLSEEQIGLWLSEEQISTHPAKWSRNKWILMQHVSVTDEDNGTLSVEMQHSVNIIIMKYLKCMDGWTTSMKRRVSM